MQERRPCLITYDERTHICCDLHDGHEGPCDTTHSRAEQVRRCEQEIRMAEHALYAARGQSPPRNRRERRMRVA